MKKLLFLYCSLFVIHCSLSAQSKYRLLGDTVLMYSFGANGSTLVLENSTRYRTGAFLRNVANGRTDFAYAIDSSRISNDTMFFHRGDGWYALKLPASGGGGGGGTDTSHLSNRIDQKLNIADTGSMLSQYLVKANAAVIYKTITAHNADTATLGSNSRALVDATNTAVAGKEPTITAGTTLQYWRGDKTWQTLPAAVDTTPLGSRLTSVINTTNTAVAGKEPTIAAGTSGQYWRGDKTWQALPGAVDTTPLGSRLTSVINTTNGNVATNTSAIAGKENALGNPSINGQVLSSTTAGVRSWITGSASGDSSFNTVEIGVPYATIGTLLNENFGTTPASFTKGANLTVTYSGKAIVTGANFWTIPPSQGLNTTAWGAGLQYNTRRMPYEKMDFSITVVPQTKSAGGLIALTKGRLDNSGGLVNSNRATIAWDLSNSYTSGRVGTGYDSVVTFVTSNDSSSRMSWNAGDTLMLYGHIDGFGTTAGIHNKTQRTSSVQKMSTVLSSGGLWNFIFLKGTFHVLNAKASSFNRKGGVYVIGTSQTAGAGVLQESRRYANQMFASNDKYFSVVGLPSVSGKAFVNGGLPAELIADAQPSKVLLEMEYNDESDPTTAVTYSQTIDSIIYPFQRSGATFYTISSIPRQSASTVYNDTLVAVAGRRNSTVIDVTTPLKNGGTMMYGGYLYDPVHVNAAGNSLMSNIILAKVGGELLSEMAADTFSVAKYSGLHSAQTEDVIRMAGFNRNSDGTYELVLLPNYQSKTGSGLISNQYTLNTNSPKTIAQTNSLIHTSNEIRTDSYFHNSANGYGLRMHFGNDSSTATQTNAEITNSGTGGTGLGAVFRNWPTDGYNVSIGGHTKTASLGTLTSAAKYNIGIGKDNLNAITSGTSNTEIVNNGTSGITSGSNIVNISNNATGPTTSSNQIRIGDAGGASWGDAANSIFIGKRNGSVSESIASGDIILEAGTNISQTLYVGGKTNGFNVAAGYFIRPPATGSTGGQIQLGVGNDFRLGGGQQFSSIYKGGSIGFSTSLPSTSTVLNDRLVATNDVVIANSGMQMTGTSKGFIPTTVTTTQRDNMRVLQSIAIGAGGTGVTDGAALVFTGSCTITPVGYVRCTAGTITSIVISYEGAGVASGLTVAVGSGSGVTLTPTVGIPDNTTVICSDCTGTDGSVGPMQTYKAALTTWKNAW